MKIIALATLLLSINIYAEMPGPTKCDYQLCKCEDETVILEGQCSDYVADWEIYNILNKGTTKLTDAKEILKTLKCECKSF